MSESRFLPPRLGHRVSPDPPVELGGLQSGVIEPTLGLPGFAAGSPFSMTAGSTTAGSVTLAGTITDGEGRSGTASIELNVREVCGDGIVGDDEECDDENTADEDGCSNTCLQARR